MQGFAMIPETSQGVETFVDVLQQRALYQGDQLALSFLEHGYDDATRITYSELDQRARTVAAHLQARNLAGQRALLLFPPGLDYIAGFFGCLYAGVIAVPAYPPDPARLERTLPRLQAIVADSQACAALTTAEIMSFAEPVLEIVDDLAVLEWIATDTLDAGVADRWREPDIHAASLAFLQYTSGSTRTPRGVMVSHVNLLHNSALIAESFGAELGMTGIIWLPPYHDMGLIGGLLQPIYSNVHCVLMSPMAFLQRPLHWLQAIMHYRAAISGGPNFAYDLCVRRITPEERATLDLSSWRVAFNGAEPVRAATLVRFSETFASCGFQYKAFFPCYGLAESTLLVTNSEHDQAPVIQTVCKRALSDHRVDIIEANAPDSTTLVSSGRTPTSQSVFIVDPQTRQLCTDDRVGEIWISGSSVAQGYWNRSEETEAVFQAQLADGSAGSFLRSGDLGFMHQGELFVTGRLKDLIIIDGRNHYPQDIEATTEASHARLRGGGSAAFAIGDDSEQLVIVAEVERTAMRQLQSADGTDSSLLAEEMIAAIRQAVFEEHNVRATAVVLLRPGRIPKTSSGKIQRHACRQEFLNDTLESVATSKLSAVDSEQPPEVAPLPNREDILAAAPEQRLALVETALTLLTARILRLPPSDVDSLQALSAHGLDSINAVELMHEIETRFGATLPIAAFLRGDSIRQLAEAMLPHIGETPAPEVAAVSDLNEVQPLSYGQRALWFLQQLTPEQSVYTLTNTVRLRGALDTAALQRALARLVARHPGLRTTFAVQNGEPVQIVHADLPAEFAVENASGWDNQTLDERLQREVYRRFDLEHGPLLRLMLYRRSDEELLALLSIHHLVTDFWSLALLVDDLTTLYRAEMGQSPLPTLQPPGASHADYAAAERALIASDEGERLWKYWQQQLAGELPVLALPTDRLRSSTPSYRGATVSRRIDRAVSERLFSLGREYSATPFMVVLAAFYGLLYRHTGQNDLIVGMPQAQRRSAWARSMGYFVNSLPVRARVDGEMRFSDLLAQTRQLMLDAFEYGAYPFPLLVERLQPEREPGRPPIFQVMAVWQKTLHPDGEDLTPFALNDDGGRIALGDATIESLPLAPRVVPFDLTLLAGEADGQLTITFEYNTALFEPTTMRTLLEHLEALLTGIAVDPACQASRLPMLSETERELILREWNARRPVPAASALVHELFAEQAARTPQATALVAPGNNGQSQITLSYAELEQQANQLAHYLRRHGIGPEMPVAVCIERSPRVVVALLAILKAGGVYLPLDPATPAERLNLILNDAEARVVVTQERLRPLFSDSSAVTSGTCTLVCLDSEAAQIAAEPTHCPKSSLQATNAAYIFYTSGSTGIPKGVVIEHATLAQHCLAAQQHYELTAQDCVLQFAAMTFDPSVEQILPPLLTGARVAIRDERLWTADEFATQAINLGLTVINIPPAYWQQLAEIWSRRPELLTGHSIRLTIIGGDRIATETIRLWSKTPLASARLLNAYGPTEATITATTAEIELDDEEKIAARPVVIGRPLPGRTAYILDESGEPVAVGVPGELHLGGIGIARGYLNRPELTQEHFVADRFSGVTGAHLYRTGDRARYRSDGEIEFLGRVDQQVKIRGMRVEPGEIEAILRRQEHVQDALVVATTDEQGETRLIGYVIATTEAAHTARTAGQVQPPGGLDAAALRARLQSQLPEYMLPSELIPIDAWPLTASGKIDRQALPAPTYRKADAEADRVAPRNALEARLAEIWIQALNLEQVGVHDNFFALGGHSLLATRLIGQVREEFNAQISLLSLFERPTIEAMSALILESQVENSDVDIEELTELLDELEQIPDEIARDLLDRS